MSDIYGDQTVLLMHCDGANGSQDFKDSSYSAFLSPVGNTHHNSTTSKFGTSSALFDGVGDHILVSSIKTPGGALTVEGWVFARPTQDGGCVMATRHTGVIGFILGLSNGSAAGSSGLKPFFGFYVSSWVLAFSADDIPTNEWVHLAGTCDGATLRLFVNGVMKASLAGSLPPFAGDGFIGASWNTGNSFNGYMEEVRLTAGVARYTADFSPPTGLFDDPTIFKADDSPASLDQTIMHLPCDGPDNSRLILDSTYRNSVFAVGNAKLSTATSKFGTSSAYFDGAGDYFQAPASSAWIFGQLDLTIECFVKLDSYSNTVTPFVGQRNNSGAPFTFGVTEQGNLAFWSSGPYVVTTVKIPLSVWTHIAVTRLGGVVRLFIGGVLAAEVTNTSNFGDAINPIHIGGDADYSQFINGYVDAVRVTKGIARYIARFVPPEKPYKIPVLTDQYWPAVVLSMPMVGSPGTAAGIVDLKGHAVTVYGDTKISAAQSKFNGVSCYFDGTGDYLTIPASADFAFGTGDFTIETWAYFAAVSTIAFTLDNGSIYIELLADGRLRFGTDIGQIVSTNQPTLNTWHHIAAQRIGPDFKLFIDGTLEGTMYSTGSYGTTPRGIVIGASSGLGALLNGCISNFRITKGVGRFQGAFTPPVEPFPSAIPQSLSGVVRDSGGSPVQRTVRSYSRITGNLVGTALSDSVTGVFELPADSTDEHFVVVFDDVKNALIYDHVVPVI